MRINDQKGLMREGDFKKRWREYFNKLLNEDSIGGLGSRNDYLLVGHIVYHRIRVVEMRKKKKTLIRLKTRKANGAR